MAATLAQILADEKDLSDLVGNPIVGDPTWRRWTNQGQERLYRLLVAKAPARFHSSQTFTLTGLGGNTVALAADFRELRESGVTKDPTIPQQRRTLRRFPFGERDAQGALRPTGFGAELAYDIQGGNIVVEPAASCAGNYAAYYLAGPVPWKEDGTQDSVPIASVFAPYVDFIAHWAAIKGAIKDESYEVVQALKLDLRDLADEILSEFKDSSDPGVIVDVYRTGGLYDVYRTGGL